MIKCIATDMDGTLLGPDHLISSASKKAIEDALASGVDVVVSTGRSYEGALYPLQQIGLELPVICMNGSQIYTKEKQLIHNITLPVELIRTCTHSLMTHDVYFEIYSSLGHLSSSHPEDAIRHVKEAFIEQQWVKPEEADERIRERFSSLNIHFVDHLEEILQDTSVEFYKIIALSKDREKFDFVRKDLEHISNIVISSSGSINIEINHVDAQKGIALQKYTKLLGFSIDEAMAIGDSYNDESMIKMAGYGISMGNAPEDIKEMANFVTDTNRNEGFAKAVYHVLEHNKK